MIVYQITNSISGSGTSAISSGMGKGNEKATSRSSQDNPFPCIASRPFAAGGHQWVVIVYPYGDSIETFDYVSMFLVLASPGRNVKALYSFRLQNQTQSHFHCCRKNQNQSRCCTQNQTPQSHQCTALLVDCQEFPPPKNGGGVEEGKTSQTVLFEGDPKDNWQKDIGNVDKLAPAGEHDNCDMIDNFSTGPADGLEQQQCNQELSRETVKMVEPVSESIDRFGVGDAAATVLERTCRGPDTSGIELPDLVKGRFSKDQPCVFEQLGWFVGFRRFAKRSIVESCGFLKDNTIVLWVSVQVLKDSKTHRVKAAVDKQSSCRWRFFRLLGKWLTPKSHCAATTVQQI
ncbi:hypothetical protein CBR_g21130 [Chara braunii]|uniref:MATH domain-containing protein n=1 Tax=Chara braunii TaxID=69332 RepID=A0A388L0V7_CHABU|nr:hypothetical protein CBR_g21130 [Chara braunii]|eukprot:GBG75888.1 hypothetical protein CBR_g21130 [Chara braunii]